jgi:hypothetical protein
LALMRRELELSAKPHAPRLRSLAALSCARQDQVSFKLRQSTEYRQHQPPMRRCCIAPGITKRLEGCPNIGNSGESIE